MDAALTWMLSSIMIILIVAVMLDNDDTPSGHV